MRQPADPDADTDTDTDPDPDTDTATDTDPDTGSDSLLGGLKVIRRQEGLDAWHRMHRVAGMLWPLTR